MTTPKGEPMGKIKELFNKLNKRHSYKVHQKLIGVTMLKCERCGEFTWSGRRDLVPLGCGAVYPTRFCKGKK